MDKRGTKSDSISKCLICGASAQRVSKHFPFCSKRCRLIDLGKWLGGDYRISRTIEQSDLEESE